MAIVSLFVTSTFLGWHLGRLYSPNYATEEAASMFIASNLIIDKEDDNDLWLSVKAGFATYQYKLSSRSVEVRLPPAHVIAGRKPPPRDALKEHEKLLELAGLAAAPAGVVGVVSKVMDVVETATAPTRRAVYLAAGAVIITGGGIGLYFGYVDSVDYDNPSFVKGLKDVDMWHSFATGIRSCRLSLKAMAVLQEIDIKYLAQRSKKLEPAVTYCDGFLKWAGDRS
ncbi:MAG: hypothetical protein HP490_07160 [Nitrospira sp.]|nr:hypothetical protein [Nitrospira sp.]